MPDTRQTPSVPSDDLSGYAGRWIARFGNQVIGQGGTPEQALQAAKASRFKETPQISYVPTTQPLNLPILLQRISVSLPEDLPVYLVGGAVRDAMLNRTIQDMDFVMPRDGLRIARQVADSLGGAFYALDPERNTGRVIYQQQGSKRVFIDFSVYQGPDLESDLKARDFTINAMAVNVRQPNALLDPLGGAVDLRTKQLRACSPDSFKSDPVRILRGVRLAVILNFRIQPNTRELMRQAVPLLPRITPERCRDELFRILDSPRTASSLRALDILGALHHVLPELPALKGVIQSPPHIADVWNHTLDCLQRLEAVLDVLGLDFDQDAAADLNMGLISLRLGRYREAIHQHLGRSDNRNRPLRPLVFLAALYHDAGKPQTRQLDENGRTRFIDHEKVGSKLIAHRAGKLHLSNAEIERLTTIVRHHMRPLWLAQIDKPPSQRAIYRFFRDTGPVGVDICLLSLADVLATYGHTLPVETWRKQLDVVRTLFDNWWERPDESVAPPVLVTGRDLISELKLDPGPEVGRLLEAIREAQATKKVQNRQEALAYARNLLKKKDG